ncbi:hypothetical protein HMPREF1006_00851 [Synergistes sp. 3_1_syn1]|nr:hypothetical protein HMPREF1006_00851 [Synergistes sp. 3_1_syn1]
MVLAEVCLNGGQIIESGIVRPLSSGGTEPS